MLSLHTRRANILCSGEFRRAAATATSSCMPAVPEITPNNNKNGLNTTESKNSCKTPQSCMRLRGNSHFLSVLISNVRFQNTFRHGGD